jgi:hypothetical protein
VPPPAVIFTEGDADNAFFKELIKVHALGVENFIIRKADPKLGESPGIGSFTKRLRNIRTDSTNPVIRNSRAIIIIADNDAAPDAQFDRIVNQINEANRDADDLFGIPIERLKPYQGSQSLPPIHILMLPWDKDAGCLETLCLAALNPKYADIPLKCVEEIVKCVGANKWSVSMLAKFKVQCLLTSIFDESPYTHLLYAWDVNADKGRPADKFPVFQLNHPVFTPIAEFLKSFTD